MERRDRIELKTEHGKVDLILRKGHLAEIEHLYVELAHRNQGYGTELMTIAEATARRHGRKKISLLCRNDNIAAVNLYKKLGYSIEGVLKDHFENGVDILVFSKFIKQKTKQLEKKKEREENVYKRINNSKK